MAEINGLPLATSPAIYHTFINESSERTFAPLYNIQFSLHIGDIYQDKELYFYQTFKPIKNAKNLTKHTYMAIWHLLWVKNSVGVEAWYQNDLSRCT